MKAIKKIAYFVMALVITGCVVILICAFNPALTQKLAALVNRLQGYNSSQEVSQKPDWIPSGGKDDYIPPEELPQSVPEEVSNLLGFEPVIGTIQEINQDEADNLGEVLSAGETGEEYEFSEEQYPYYGMLDPTLQQIYRQIYANAMELNTSFVPALAVSTNQVKRVVEAVYYDHPELFWLEGEYSCKYLPSGICVEITLKYNSLVKDLEQAKNDFNECSEEILTGTENMQSIQEKEKYIHDVLLKIVVYDKDADWNQSAYSAIVRGNTVCAGYTRAFQYLMQQLGIPCYYCTGFAGEDHAWNIVKIGDTYYNTDVTWDDTEPGTYQYFNQTDDAFASTHVRTGMSVYLPACVEEGETAENKNESNQSEIDAYINPNPQVPLTWHSRGGKEEDTQLTEEEIRTEELKKLGIDPEQYASTMEEYYDVSGKGLKKAGAGYKQYITVIPESLWSDVEKAYSSGEYKKAYVDAVLKELKLEEFSIQLQVQRLGNGYYKLYHNVYTE